MKYVWVLQEHYDYEGSQLYGVFETAGNAKKWIEKTYGKPVARSLRWKWYGMKNGWSTLERGSHYSITREKIR